MAFDVQAVRSEFPILLREVHNRPLVYLDSAASAQKPRAVIDAMSRAMEHSYACLLYTSPSPRDRQKSRMPSSA